MFADQFEIEVDALVGLAVIGALGFIILTLGVVYHV